MRDVLLSVRPKLRALDVPEWGRVWVRQWSGQERAEFRKAYQAEDKESSRLDAVMLVMSVCDEQGNRVFDMSDVDRILCLPASILDSVNSEILTVNGLGPDNVEHAKKN